VRKEKKKKEKKFLMFFSTFFFFFLFFNTETSSAFSIEPDRAVRQTRYLCSKQFELAELDELMAPPEAELTYGIALVFGRETQLWRISALQAIRVASLETSTQKHHRKGGQSQGRIGRLRENKQKHNVSFVGEELHAAFYDHDTNRPTVSGLVVAGAAQMHELVTDELADSLRSVLVGVYPWPDTNVRRLFEHVQDDIARFHLNVERAALAPLHELLAVRPELLEFGSCESILERLPYFATVFLDARLHREAVAQLMARGALANNVVIIRVAEDLDAYNGVVAIKHMMSNDQDEDNTNEN
jgi:peptide subunit release factor 1 (eRF1)